MTYLFYTLLGFVLLFPVLVKFLGDILKKVEEKLPEISEDELKHQSQAAPF